MSDQTLSEANSPEYETGNVDNGPSHPSAGPPVRVVLFDIDGTLIRAVRRREYRRLTREMLVDIFGTCGRLDEVDFAGKTDLSIYSEALECEGITLANIREMLAVLEEAKVEVITTMAREGAVFDVCAGVRELLERLAGDARFVPSLLTGNLERLAETKLKLVGLWRYFKVRGAFGSDHEDRHRLPAIAAQRITDYFGHTLEADRFIVVGDTPRDISCARSFGARVVAVASGQHSVEQLAEFSPDAIVGDLSNTDEILELLMKV